MGTWESNGKSDEWYTPQYIFDAMNATFDLDVAAPEEGPRYVPVTQWHSEDSLSKPWHGFVWMNPPFGAEMDLSLGWRSLLNTETVLLWFQTEQARHGFNGFSQQCPVRCLQTAR